MDRERIIDSALIALTLCALLLATDRWARTRSPDPTGTGPAARVENWTDYAAEGLWMGPEDAAVVMVEFSDFECPFCRAAQDELRVLRRQFPESLAVVYRHFPLSFHENAVAAAIAAECADRAGSFQRYHDLLYENQLALGSDPWIEFASAAGIDDLAAFERCLLDPVANDRVERDQAAAIALSLPGTPAFIIDGQLFHGYPGNDVLAGIVEHALQAREQR